MEELINDIEERIVHLQGKPCLVNFGRISDLSLIIMKLKRLNNDTRRVGTREMEAGRQNCSKCKKPY